MPIGLRFLSLWIYFPIILRVTKEETLAQRLVLTDEERLGTRAMDSATLAVVGTLSGVVITATAALLGNLLTARQQRATTER
jgi:hypothetical protein